MIYENGKIIVENKDVMYAFDGSVNHPNLAIQNFAYSKINRNHVYTTQHAIGDTVLSKYERGSNPIRAWHIGEIGLANCGHGETLETVYLENDLYEYVWVGSDFDTTGNNQFATQIQRMLLSADMQVLEVKKLSGFECASHNGQPLYSGNVTRVMACISDDGTRICFKINFKGSGPFFSIYNYAQVNYAMNISEKQNVSMKDLRYCCLGVYKGNPFQIFQSMDMGKNNELFISSGNLNEGIDNKISRYVLKDNSVGIENFPSPSSTKIIKFSNDFGYGTYELAEIEGIKYSQGTISFTADFKTNSQGFKDGQSANRTAMVSVDASRISK